MPCAGRGRQVIAVCKSADLLLMVLDASKPHAHRKILTAELEAVGIRLNRRHPSIYFKKKKTGGISFNATIPLTRMDEKLCQRILQVRSQAWEFLGCQSLAALLNHCTPPSPAPLLCLWCRPSICTCVTLCGAKSIPIVA